MKKINQVVAELIKKTGESDKAIAFKLGLSSQRVGQYKNGTRTPGVEFLRLWKEKYGDDIMAMANNETDVSQGTPAQNAEVSQLKQTIEDQRQLINSLKKVVDSQDKVLDHYRSWEEESKREVAQLRKELEECRQKQAKKAVV